MVKRLLKADQVVIIDSNAKESIIEDINPQRGIESELNRVLNKNDSLRKSATWSGATNKQYSSIRNRMVADTTTDALKIKRNDKTFIRVDEDNYRRVTRDKDVYKSEKTDTVWIRDSKGRFKEVIK